jgi:hypothetical protein
MKTQLILAATVLMAGTSAFAQRAPFSTIASQNIFGNTYSVEIFRVAGDYSNAPNTGARVEPEGMVFHNGVLYVSSDAPANESNGYLAAYAGGDLRFLPNAVGRFTVTNGTATQPFGAEGITVNTRGSGYGSFGGATPNIIGVDNVGAPFGRSLAVQNLSSVTITDRVGSFTNSDDITYVPGVDAASDRFAVLNGGSNPPSINFFSTASTPAALPGSFNLPLGAKGVVYLSAADALLFSSLATGPSLLVGSSPDGPTQTNNLLGLYSLDGTLIAQSVLPVGLGAGLLGNVEALAWDPATRRLFIGDENGINSQIAVLTIPAPSVFGTLALAGLAAARRRRA